MHAGVELIFRPHALREMRRRRVTEELVRMVLGDYDQEIVRDEDGRIEYAGTVYGRLIRVVLEPGDEPYFVVTIIARKERR